MRDKHYSWCDPGNFVNFVNYHVKQGKCEVRSVLVTFYLLYAQLLPHTSHLLPHCLNEVVMASNIRGDDGKLFPVVSAQHEGNNKQIIT